MEDLTVAFNTLKMEAAKIGLHFNEKKCELIANDDSVIQRFQTVAPDIIIVDPATAVLPTTPVGEQQSVDLVLENMLWKLNCSAIV
jgi:hydroxymethylpyrimidine/phosphomethylpyrimidine kinase